MNKIRKNAGSLQTFHKVKFLRDFIFSVDEQCKLASSVHYQVTCVYLMWFQSAECDDLLSGHLPVVAVSVQLPGHPVVSPGPQPQPKVSHYTSVNMNTT